MPSLDRERRTGTLKDLLYGATVVITDSPVDKPNLVLYHQPDGQISAASL